MEAMIVDAIIESVIIAVRKDLINCLIDTECCKWSKRKIKKLAKKLQAHADDEQSIEEAKDKVRKTIADLSQSVSPPESLEEEPIYETLKERSIIHEFVKKMSLI